MGAGQRSQAKKEKAARFFAMKEQKDVEQLYSFIHENDLRHEAAELLRYLMKNTYKSSSRKRAAKKLQ